MYDAVSKRDYLFSGVFFEQDVISQIRKHLGMQGLEKSILCPHVTFDYGGITNTDWFGARIKVTINGYGNDGKNEAVSVDVNLYDVPKMRGLIPVISRKKLHITLSFAKDSEPKLSKNLSYTPIPKLVVYGRYGGFEKRHFVVADSIVAEDLRRNAKPFFGILDGTHTVSAKTLMELKQKASRYCNQLNRDTDTMVVVPAKDNAYLCCRENIAGKSGKWIVKGD